VKGLSRRALEDGGTGELWRESFGQMGEKEEEKKGHLWRDSPRSKAHGERASGGELWRPTAVPSDGGASVSNLRWKTAERVRLGERML
jgi:hypothetical protein